MIRKNQMCQKTILAQTSHATPGTRSTHAHGFTGVLPTVAEIRAHATSVDGDVADAGFVNVVKVDATYIYVKSNIASCPFFLVIDRNYDDGGRP